MEITNGKPNKKKDLEEKITLLETKLSKLASQLDPEPEPKMYLGFGNSIRDPQVTVADERKRLALEAYEKEYLERNAKEQKDMENQFKDARMIRGTLPRGFGSGQASYKPKENKSLTRRFVENRSKPSILQKVLVGIGMAKVKKTEPKKSKGFGSGQRGTLPKGF